MCGEENFLKEAFLPHTPLSFKNFENGVLFFYQICAFIDELIYQRTNNEKNNTSHVSNSLKRGCEGESFLLRKFLPHKKKHFKVFEE